LNGQIPTIPLEFLTMWGNMARTELPGNRNLVYAAQSSWHNFKGKTRALFLLADPYEKLKYAKMISCIS
jgi:hypothetical protein